MFIMFDVLGTPDEHEPDALPAAVAGRKMLTVYTSHFVFCGMPVIMHNTVDSRPFYLFTRFEFLCHYQILLTFSPTLHLG